MYGSSSSVDASTPVAPASYVASSSAVPVAPAGYEPSSAASSPVATAPVYTGPTSATESPEATAPYYSSVEDTTSTATVYLTSTVSTVTTAYDTTCTEASVYTSGEITLTSTATLTSSVTSTYLTTVTLSYNSESSLVPAQTPTAYAGFTSPAGYTPVGYTSTASESAPAAYSPSTGESAPAVYSSTSVATAPAGYSPTTSDVSAVSTASHLPPAYSGPSVPYGGYGNTTVLPSGSSATGYSASSYVGSGSATTTSFSFYTASSSISANSSSPVAPTAYSSSSVISAAPIYSANSTSSISAPVTAVYTTAASVVVPTASANSTSSSISSTTSMAPIASVSASVLSDTYCSNLCSTLSFGNLGVTPYSCQAYSAGDAIPVAGGQTTVGCAAGAKTSVDICRVTLSIATSGSSSNYVEVWLPNGNTTAWNGRTMNTDNGGANGCVHYVDMQYVSGLGFAAIGDNGGHNSSSFDGTWMYQNNEAILDWVYRSRHESVVAGKEIVSQFYGESADYSYYIGCSTGGQQGLHSAQHHPDDFDGIIAGSSAADFNHLQAWSARFIQLTGIAGSATFLTSAQWITVQSAIFAQCDEALDGVADGILEDPTICKFDASVLTEATYNLTATQVQTVRDVFSELYNTEGQLLYPALLLGSQVDAFRLGQLSGNIQGIAQNFYGDGVHNDSSFDITTLGQADYALADSQDELHGYVSAFNGDLSAFQATGHKLLMYHGMADPLVAGSNSQRYYLKVAKTMGLGNTQLDDFMRLFRISGMAHCGVGGISGAGAWMFGQNLAADPTGIADNIVDRLVDWVENDNAPETLTGTKFWYDTPSYGVELQRAHCRFPYRTTYNGAGDANLPGSWSCAFIDDWQTCGIDALPRLCNADGTFAP